MRLEAQHVRMIRLASKNGTSQAELAKQYDVHPQTISKIIARRTWAEVR